MRVRFYGVRGSIATAGDENHRYGGNTSCVVFEAGGETLIFDAGTGLRKAGADLMRAHGPTGVNAHLFFSHLHWDHIQGFPFFTPAYAPQNTFHVYGTAEGDKRTYDLLSGQMRSEYFPVDFGELRSNIVASHLDGGHRVIDGCAVSYYEQQHPGRSWAYSFVKDGYKIVYATDNEIDLTLADPKAVAADPLAPRPIPEGFRRFCHGADLLISDAQYFDDEYLTKVGWGHPRATTVVDLALQAEVKQVALFHHDPMHGDTDVDRKIALCKERAARINPALQVFGAREGLELRFG